MVVARGLSAPADAALKGPRYIDVKTALKPDVVLQDISRTLKMSRLEDGTWPEGGLIASISELR